MKRNYLFLIGLFIVLLYYLPFILLGEDMFVYDHDFLDSHHAYLKVLADRGELFSFGVFPAMEGVNVSGFDSMYPLRLALYYFFSPFTAMIIGDLIARVFAYSGMFLLLNKFCDNDAKFSIIALLCSILFGFLYFHDGYFELGSAGMPMLAFCFMNLYNHKYVAWSYAFIVFFSSFSSIFHAAFFCCIVLGAFVFYDYYQNKKLNRQFVVAILVLGFSSVVFSYHTILAFFVSDQISHRVEFEDGLPLLSAIQAAINMALVTQEHTGILPTAVIWLTIIVLLLMKRFKNVDKKIYLCLSYIAAILLFYVCYQVAKYYLPGFKYIQIFQADRFYFMLPTIFMCLYFFACKEVLAYKYGMKSMVVGVVLLFFSICLYNPEYRQLGKSIAIGNDNYPNYRQFYDEKLFSQIKDEIKDMTSSKCCAIGMYPSILTYNNLNTVDGYFVSYPLYYKHMFRDVISKELDNSDFLKSYFDKWGSRCYVFSSELEKDGNMFMCGKKRNITIEKLDINTSALKATGCSYVFSSVDVKNYKELNLEYINSYTTDKSFWNIRVYKVI